MVSDEFHNGYGMMTLHDIRKPVWRAFQMLQGAGDKQLYDELVLMHVLQNACVQTTT